MTKRLKWGFYTEEWITKTWKMQTMKVLLQWMMNSES